MPDRRRGGPAAPSLETEGGRLASRSRSDPAGPRGQRLHVPRERSAPPEGREASGEQLQIRLFGEPRLSVGGVLFPPFPTRKAASLFGYLVHGRGQVFHRDVLCGALWGDRTDTRARRALRTTLWRVKETLTAVDERWEGLLHVEGRRLGFSGRAWVDVHAFEEHRRRPGPSPPSSGDGSRTRTDGARGVERLIRATELYVGDFLEGVEDEWCVRERGRLRMALLTTLERILAHYRDREEWLEAASWGRALLRRDPFREHVHRILMECHLARGDRPSAIRQYQECARVLESELGVRPMEETRRLHRRIRRGGPEGAPGERGPPPGEGSDGGRSAPPETAKLDQILHELRRLRTLLGDRSPGADG